MSIEVVAALVCPYTPPKPAAGYCISVKSPAAGGGCSAGAGRPPVAGPPAPPTRLLALHPAATIADTTTASAHTMARATHAPLSSRHHRPPDGHRWRSTSPSHRECNCRRRQFRAVAEAAADFQLPRPLGLATMADMSKLVVRWWRLPDRQP
jgi:hypothetical protein